jgi:hypothetical protein
MLNLTPVLTSRPVLKWEGRDAIGVPVRIEIEDGYFAYYVEHEFSDQWQRAQLESTKLRALEAMVSDLMEKQAEVKG